MANNFKHKKVTTDTLKVKGVIEHSDIDPNVYYINYYKDDEEYSVNIKNLFSQFDGDEINLIITTKEEIDLEE